MGRRAERARCPPADYFPGIWQTNLIHDGLYGIPWDLDTRVIF